MTTVLEPHRQRIWDALRRHKFQEAAQLRAAYEAAQQTPIGISVDWQKYDMSRDVAWLSAIWKGQPKILKGLQRAAFEPTRLAAAMLVLGEGDPRKYVAADLATGIRLDSSSVARQWVSSAFFLIEIATYREWGFVKKVQVQGANDDWVCAPCLALQANKFDLAQAPVLPYEHCTSDGGCRCSISAVDLLE